MTAARIGKTYRRLIARNMEQEFLFWETDSGEDGLRLYNTEQPDCVLLDYNLPDLNGLEFLARLDPERSEDAPPIIMLTGQGTERVAVQALKMGAQDYLIKNRAAETVKYVVHSVIEKAALSRQIKEQRREQERTAQALRESEERYRLWGVRALRESEERYRLLIEGVMGYAIVMLDPDGYVLLWNAGAEKLYGYRADEIIGRRFLLLLSGRGHRGRPSPARAQCCRRRGKLRAGWLENPQGRLTILGPRQSNTAAKRVR